MRILLLKLWNTTFHLESKFLRTCWQLFVPGKVTFEFFNGKQNRYPHPLRMFAVVMFFFLLVLNTMLKKENKGELIKVSKTVNTEQGDSIVEEKSISSYEKMKYKVMLHDIRADYESLPPSLHTRQSREAVDSLLLKNNLRNRIDDLGLLDSLDESTDTTNIVFFGGHKLSIATMDMVRYEPEEIIKRYNITNWMLKLLLRQTIKSYKNPEGFVHAYIGSLTWAILALVAVMSALLSLLYWRQKRYYVEHFIFLLHYHTGMMLALLLISFGIIAGIWGIPMFGLVFLWATVSMFLAMRRFYGQGRGKTFLKWLIFGFLYFFSFIFLFVLGTLLVFAIY